MFRSGGHGPGPAGSKQSPHPRQTTRSLHSRRNTPSLRSRQNNPASISESAFNHPDMHHAFNQSHPQPPQQPQMAPCPILWHAGLPLQQQPPPQPSPQPFMPPPLEYAESPSQPPMSQNHQALPMHPYYGSQIAGPQMNITPQELPSHPPMWPNHQALPMHSGHERQRMDVIPQAYRAGYYGGPHRYYGYPFAPHPR